MSSVICRIEFGSHLYGTNTPTSDRDWKGVVIPDARDIVLQRVKDSDGHRVIRPEGEKNTPQDVDDENYSLQRYLKLLAEGQTVAIDMLFAPKPIVRTMIWDHIKLNKDKLLTKKSASFLGYCRTQANKYGIKGSRMGEVRKVAEFFTKATEASTTAKVGDVDYMLTSLEGEHTFAAVYKENPRGSGKMEKFFQCCNRMVNYRQTVKEAAKVYNAIFDEYGKRARLAEANEGIDWKALSHAVRVGYEAIELLQTRNVTFPLPYKDHILEIKQGKLPYKIVAEEIENLLVRVEEEAAKSTLRDEPDYAWIDDYVYNVYGVTVAQEFRQR